jgi:hypothetical protein
LNPQFLVFEVLIYILFVASLYRAVQQGSSRVSELLFGALYGVFLEWMTIQQLSAYKYGHFLVMIDGAPLCIGLAWSVIIFGGMEYVKQLEIPGIARPFLIGFLALNMDLACDAIAIRQGFWTWAIPLNAQWFGVPWGNFWAWYIVVTSYSGMLYVFQTRQWRTSKSFWKRWGYVPLAMTISIVILALTNYLFLYEFGANGISGLLSMGFLLQAGALIVITFRPKVPATAKVDPLSFAAALVFHIYFNWIGFQNGYYRQIPILGFAGMLMLLLGLFIHLYPAWRARKIRQSALN